MSRVRLLSHCRSSIDNRHRPCPVCDGLYTMFVRGDDIPMHKSLLDWAEMNWEMEGGRENWKQTQAGEDEKKKARE